MLTPCDTHLLLKTLYLYIMCAMVITNTHSAQKARTMLEEDDQANNHNL